MKLTYTILYVEDVTKSIEFYQNALGLKHKFTHESGEYAEMDTGETTLAFCKHSLADMILNQTYQKSSLQNPPLGTQITFEPKNVKQAYDKAITCGATSIAAPEVKPWNFEVAILRDCDGHVFELAKDLN